MGPIRFSRNAETRTYALNRLSVFDGPRAYHVPFPLVRETVRRKFGTWWNKSLHVCLGWLQGGDYFLASHVNDLIDVRIP